MKPVVVAVDGAAGSGKSSVSKGVASTLDLAYLDTGAMYRAMTWWLLQQQVDVSSDQQVGALASRCPIVSGSDPRNPTITVDGVDVSEQIRTPEVTAAVSSVSAVVRVRDLLTELMRSIVAAHVTAGRGIIVEGRDIGTVVLPDADLKVFLTADPAVRAARRAAENNQRGIAASVDQTEAELVKRDHADATRATSPLQQADDAVIVDSSDDDLPTVIGKVANLIRQVQG